MYEETEKHTSSQARNFSMFILGFQCLFDDYSRSYLLSDVSEINRKLHVQS